MLGWKVVGEGVWVGRMQEEAEGLTWAWGRVRQKGRGPSSSSSCRKKGKSDVSRYVGRAERGMGLVKVGNGGMWSRGV